MSEQIRFIIIRYLIPIQIIAINLKIRLTKYNYINEDNNTYIDGKWKGNHKFINNHRNKMTHRNSPSITSMSDVDFNFENPTNYILKRLIEDYTVVSEFIS